MQKINWVGNEEERFDFLLSQSDILNKMSRQNILEKYGSNKERLLTFARFSIDLDYLADKYGEGYDFDKQFREIWDDLSRKRTGKLSNYDTTFSNIIEYLRGDDTIRRYKMQFPEKNALAIFTPQVKRQIFNETLLGFNKFDAEVVYDLWLYFTGVKGTDQEQPFEDYFEQYHSNFYKPFGNVVYDYRSNEFVRNLLKNQDLGFLYMKSFGFFDNDVLIRELDKFHYRFKKTIPLYILIHDCDDVNEAIEYVKRAYDEEEGSLQNKDEKYQASTYCIAARRTNFKKLGISYENVDIANLENKFEDFDSQTINYRAILYFIQNFERDLVDLITDLFGRILKADRSKFSNDFLKELLFYLEDHFDNLDAARGFLQFLGQRVAVRMDFKILDLLDFKVEDYILEIFNFMKTLDNKDLVDNYIKDLHDLLEDVHNKYKEKLDFTNPDMDDKTRMKRLKSIFSNYNDDVDYIKNLKSFRDMLIRDIELWYLLDGKNLTLKEKIAVHNAAIEHEDNQEDRISFINETVAEFEAEKAKQHQKVITDPVENSGATITIRDLVQRIRELAANIGIQGEIGTSYINDLLDQKYSSIKDNLNPQNVSTIMKYFNRLFKHDLEQQKAQQQKQQAQVQQQQQPEEDTKILYSYDLL